MSPRREAVIQTPDKRPDLVVSRLEVPVAKVGEKVHFKATLQNIGTGATPQNTLLGMTFFVDGQYISYQTQNRVLPAGGNLDFEADGTWMATQGAHVLHTFADDINRVSGEYNEGNNFADASLPVESPTTGLLSGATSAASGQVDLTREGALDWVLWGLGGNNNVTRKTGVMPQIGSDLVKSGEGYRDSTPGFAVSARWSDGTPVKAMDDCHSSLWWNGVGHAYTFSVPADTREKVLRVYVAGIEGAGGKLTTHLSDGSAPDYVSTTWDGNRSNG